MEILSHIDYLAGVVAFIAFIFLMAAKRLPSPEGFDKFLHSLDTRGGNILILSSFSLWSAVQGIKLFWHLIYLVQADKLKGAEGVTNVAIAFVTTNLASSFIGALIKTLTGSSDPLPPKAEVADAPKAP